MFQDRNRTKEVSIDPVQRGVALLLDDAFVRSLVAFQRRASDILPLTPILSETGNLPHVTLVQGTFSRVTKLEPVLESVSCTLAKARKGEIQLEAIAYQPKGWVFLEVVRSPWLQGLHNDVAHSLAELMLKPDYIDPEKLAEYTALERDNACRYGYRYMFDAFHPHITLGRSDVEITQEHIERLNVLWKSFDVARNQDITAASIYEMGMNGAHARALVSRPAMPIK